MFKKSFRYLSRTVETSAPPNVRSRTVATPVSSQKHHQHQMEHDQQPPSPLPQQQQQHALLSIFHKNAQIRQNNQRILQQNQNNNQDYRQQQHHQYYSQFSNDEEVLQSSFLKYLFGPVTRSKLSFCVSVLFLLLLIPDMIDNHISETLRHSFLVDSILKEERKKAKKK